MNEYQIEARAKRRAALVGLLDRNQIERLVLTPEFTGGMSITQLRAWAVTNWNYDLETEIKRIVAMACEEETP